MKNTIRPANRHISYLPECNPLRTPYPISKSVGGINIVKLFESLGKHDGSSVLDLLKEYIDNSFDWGSSKITIRFDIKNKKIIITDDGNGMNINSFQKFCELWSDNDLDVQNEKVDGKFGIGVKKANRVLSDMQFVEVNTIKDGKLINGTIDYQKILHKNKYDETSVPIEIFDTSLSNGTEIIISTTDEIITHFKDIYDSKKIDENLRFDLAMTYTPKILEDKEINLEFYDETSNEVISEKIKPIQFESDDFITKTYVLNLYKKDNRKTFTYALDSKTNIKKTCSHPYNSFKEENICDYNNLNSSLEFELKFPKETKTFSIRKGGKEKINVCTINKDIEINFYKNIKSIYNITDSNSKILDFMKHIHIKRNTRVLARLNFDVKDVSSTTDSNQKNEYNSCIKTLSYLSSIDKHLSLAQETKSKVDWSKCPRGLKKIIGLLIEDFVKCDVKTFMNEPIEGEDYSITDDEESEEETESETDSETNSDGEETNSDGEETNVVVEETNSEGEETNSEGEETNVVVEETNSEGEETNSDGEETNVVVEETNDEGEETNSDGEETNVVVEETNSDGEETNVVDNSDNYSSDSLDNNVLSKYTWVYAVTSMEDNRVNPLIKDKRIEKKNWYY